MDAEKEDYFLRNILQTVLVELGLNKAKSSLNQVLIQRSVLKFKYCHP